MFIVLHKIGDFYARTKMKTEKTNAHSKTVVSVAFSPGGTKIVSGSWDETIKVWSDDPDTIFVPSGDNANE